MTTSVSEDRKVTYNFLGRSGLKVSNINLGCMTFGESVWGIPGQCDEEQSHQILNRFVEWGGNFLDTADVYGQGKSEDIVGKWLETQSREQFVVATKCRGAMDLTQNANNIGASRRHITESIEGSLRRLRTHFVDLYQIHCWDNATPLEETIRTLDDLVRAGKIHYVGVSNFTGWQLQKLINVSEKLGLNPITSLQQQYNLICRESELEVFQVCKTEGVGVLPYSPLKGGLLTDKVSRGVAPTDGRLAWATTLSPVRFNLTDKSFDIVDVAKAIGKRRGRSTAQVAIRWLLQKDVVPSVIIGARTLAQLDDNMAAANGWSLTKEEMQQLDDVSAPTFPYPYDAVFNRNKDRVNLWANDYYVSSIW